MGGGKGCLACGAMSAPNEFYRWEHLSIIAFCIFICALAITFLVYYCSCMLKKPTPEEIREHIERLYCADLSSSAIYGGCSPSNITITGDRKTTSTSLTVPSVYKKSFLTANQFPDRASSVSEARGN
uniref:Uncharacterized protein n=1 Tax=Plectus sambesii TaxID=2011161 RepID=A0A914WA29_9BILA